MLPAAKEDAIVPEKAKNASMKFFADLAAGGVAGGISKTIVAPIERVKLLLQTQDSNPRIKSGKPRFTQATTDGPLLSHCDQVSFGLQVRFLGTLASATASPVSQQSKDLPHSGEATWPMSSGISPHRPSTLPSR